MPKATYKVGDRVVFVDVPGDSGVVEEVKRFESEEHDFFEYTVKFDDGTVEKGLVDADLRRGSNK